MKHFILSVFLIIVALFAFSESRRVAGFVFADINGNGLMDSGEKGISDVCVSDGNSVVQTDSEGRYMIEQSESNLFFVIKPSGYRVPVNTEMIPQHFQFLNSGENQNQVNFPLELSVEKQAFSAVFFGDPQARGLKEVNYINHDVVEELIGTSAAFGVSLGDITADGPELFHDINRGIAQIGIPWYNTFGNHDYDRGATTNDTRIASYQKVYGPATYAFEYGKVVFIDFNDIYFKPDGKYISHFTDTQINFLKNYMSFVPKDKLVVLMMHSPIVACDNKEKIFDLISDRKYTFSISGHVHEQINLFVDSKMGWKGSEPHHHLINGTVCGSWWCGALDEQNIPHATMNDGTPNGYSIIHFDGNSYRVQYKAARRPENYQLNIYLADDVKRSDPKMREVLVNVFAGSERSVVEMKVSVTSNWQKMSPAKVADPECERMHKLSPLLKQSVGGVVLEDTFGYTMDKPGISTHIWRAELPDQLPPGTYSLQVRTMDMFGKKWESSRIFRISE